MNSNCSYGLEMPKLGQNLFWPLTHDLWPVILTFCTNITSGNYPWKFHDDAMTRKLQKMCDGQTFSRNTTLVASFRYSWSLYGTGFTPAKWVINRFVQIRRCAVTNRHKAVLFPWLNSLFPLEEPPIIDLFLHTLCYCSPNMKTSLKIHFTSIFYTFLRLWF